MEPQQSTHDDFDASQALVHTDPVLRSVATHLLTCENHYAGSLTRSDPSALEWAAWDAYHAIDWARRADPGEQREAAFKALADSAFLNPEEPSWCCLDRHLDVIVEAAHA